MFILWLQEAEQARTELKDAQQALHDLSAQEKVKMEDEYKKKMVAAKSKVKSLERKHQVCDWIKRFMKDLTLCHVW